ncbi:hypothetical protein AAFN47_04115 [Hoeflea sp. CAU 1731]
MMPVEILNAPVELTERWATPCFDKLSKLDWPAACCVSSFGANIGLRASDNDLLRSMIDRLPPYVRLVDRDKCDTVISMIRGGREPGSRTRKFHLVYSNHSLIGRSHRIEEILNLFDFQLNIIIAAMSPSRVFVHAGAVAWRGRAIVVPGPSMSGKSSLIKELVDAGAKYLSDEYAIIDQDGRVEPLEKPISLRENGSRHQTDVPLSSMREKVAKQPYPVGLVVGTRYRETAKWKPKKLTPGQGLLLMLSNTPAGRINPLRVLSSLRNVAGQASSISSNRGDAKTTATSILQLVDEMAV